MFYVGQKVVCVRDNNDAYGREMLITKMVVYTVASLVKSNFGRDGITLQELSPPPGVVGWLNELFRPLVERKTDISIFTDMLKPKTEQVSA